MLNISRVYFYSFLEFQSQQCRLWGRKEHIGSSHLEGSTRMLLLATPVSSCAQSAEGGGGTGKE